MGLKLGRGDLYNILYVTASIIFTGYRWLLLVLFTALPGYLAGVASRTLRRSYTSRIILSDE